MENIIFSELNVSKEILKAVEKMGFEETTPIQSQSIPLILEGKDVIAQAPTGTGKTCAFGIPLIEGIDIENEAVQGLILCPTRELVIQTTQELIKLTQFIKGIKIVPVYGGQDIDRQIMALKKRPQIIVATPGRMMDHLRRRTVKIGALKMIILDEADEMLNMGFREDIDIILETVPKERQTVLFSATLSKEIMDIANRYQKNAEMIKVSHKELTIPTIEQYYIEVGGQKKVEVLSRLVDAKNYKLCLVFCNTKRKVDELTSDLSARGYSVEALHGDMKQSQRDRVMQRFRKGSIDILIATDVAARGIDVDDIEAVFNFDIPSDEEYYVHRIGRTGRAKKSGISYTFVSGKEMYKLRDIMRYTKSTIVPMKAPTISDVEEVKIKSIFEESAEIIKSGKVSKYVHHIENLLNDDETGELNTLDIAASLLSILLKNNPQTETTISEEPRAKRDNHSRLGIARMFINVGNLDKIKAKQLSDLISDNTSLSGDVVSGADIHDMYSFIDVPEEYSEEIIAGVNGKQYKGRKIAIELANERRPGRTRRSGSLPKTPGSFPKTRRAPRGRN